MWNGIPPPQMPPQQQYQQGGIAPPVPGIQNRPRLEPIDWNLVAVLNADIIRQTKDYESLQKLVQIFMGAKLYQGSSRILAHPLCLRLCQLLQVAFEYLNFCQKELSTLNTKLETENVKLTEKIAKLESKLKKSEQIIKIKSVPYDKCPICQKKFKNIDYVDRHIANRHSEINDAWDIIRGRKPPENLEKEDNVQIILDKIDNLKNSLRRGSGRNPNKSIEQELLNTQQELMNAEEMHEQQIKKQNDEIRRQLFEAADDLNSSMTLYKEHTQKKKVKKTKEQMAIVNLFDQNAEVNYPNAEPSPFNRNQEEELTKQKRINDFFNQPVNPFQKHQFRPSNEVEDGPNWETQMDNRNKVVNPFQNKANQMQLSIPPENQNNAHIQNQNNLDNNLFNEDEFGFNEMKSNNVFDNVQPIMNAGFKNNFSIDNLNQNNIQVIPQSMPKTLENDQLIKPIPKQAILAAKKFISKQNNDRNANTRNVNATPESIEQVITMIGERVHDEVQRLGPNGAASVMLRQKYGDNDPNYMQLRKQIQQKLEMEYPIDGQVTKVKKGFDLVHTEDLTSINNNNQNQNYNNNNNQYNDNIYDTVDPLYSSPSKEKLIMNKNNLASYGDSEFTSAFEFQSNKNKHQQQTTDERQKENIEEINDEKKKKGSPKKKKMEISEVISTSSQDIQKSGISNSNSKLKSKDKDQKQNEDDVWSYINSSTSEKATAKQDDDENKKAQNSPSIVKEVNRHSISFDSTSSSSKLKTKNKTTKDNNKTEFDFIQSDMKPNFSESPSRKTETQALTPVQNQGQNRSKVSASIIKSDNNKNDGLNYSKSDVDNKLNRSSEKDDFKTPERQQPIKSDIVSLEIFKSPVLSGSSNHNLSAKSRSKITSNRKISLDDDDEDIVENLSDIDRMFQKSKDLSENSELGSNQNQNANSNKIEPLSEEDEFNFPPVSSDSFFNSSDDEKRSHNNKIIKEKLDKQNQLSNRRESNNSNIRNSELNYRSPSRSNLNSNIVDKDSESQQSNANSTSKSRQSRMSVLSSAIRIGRADDTKAVFQSSSINETSSPTSGAKEPVISRRKHSPIRNPNKDNPSAKNNNVSIAIDDIDPKEEEEKEKKRRYDEYKRIAEEKFKKEFDFDIDVANDEQQANNKKDDSLDEFELTGKSNEEKSILEEEEIDDSEDESGLANPPPRIEFHLKATDDDNDIPVKNIINDSNSNNKSGIKIADDSETKFDQRQKLIMVDNNNDNKVNNSNKTNNSLLSNEVKKAILKQTGINMINKTNTKYGQPRSNYDSSASRIKVDDQPSKQFNEDTDKKNQFLSNSFLKNSRNFSTSRNKNVNHNDYSDEDNKYGYVSDDEDEINGLPRPDYFKAIDDDVIRKNKNYKPNRKPNEENSLFSSPLPPDPSVSSDSVYQPENERLTFYEKKTKSSKTRASSSSKKKQKDEKKDDPYEFTEAEPSFLLKVGNHSDDF